MSFDLSSSYRRSATSLWSVIFRCEGNIMIAVLPFCLVNYLLLELVAYYRQKYHIGFSPNGHGLLTLLVSFLVISKVNLAYDRYKAVREHAGKGFLVLRELVQMSITISNAITINPNRNVNVKLSPKDANDQAKRLTDWRLECAGKVADLMDLSVQVLQDKSLAKHFSYDKPLKESLTTKNPVDPLTRIQSLRLHLYCASDLGLEPIECVQLVNKLQEYGSSYNQLLILSSTPLPFPLVQMARAFLLVWTFSMPLVLLEGPFQDTYAAQTFLFFLTYGFIGLELVSIKLSDPFGHSRDDVQLSKMRDAALIGIENDMKVLSTQTAIRERRVLFAQQKDDYQQQFIGTLTQSQGTNQHSNNHSDVYHAMFGSLSQDTDLQTNDQSEVYHSMSTGSIPDVEGWNRYKVDGANTDSGD